MRLQCNAQRLDRRMRPAKHDLRLRAIFDNQLKWVSGTRLTFSFLDKNPIYQEAVRRSLAEWMQWAAIGFDEVQSGGQIRISFDPMDGSWSYLGRDLLAIDAADPTMNIGWSPLSDPNVVPHEIGHTLGLHHEHQNAGIDWDRETVLAELSGPPNYWSKEVIEYNVLNVIPKDSVIGSEIADPNSIMMYDIPASWIKSGAWAQTGIHPQGGISAADKYWAAIVYPKLETEPPVDPTDPDEPAQVAQPIEFNLFLSAGKQAEVKFQVPERAEYRIRTTGKADTVCVLFENGKQIAADDDSGEDRNALIEHELAPGNEYKAVTRMYYKSSRANIGIRVEPI